MGVTDVYDATTGNVGRLPPGQAAGYDTGPGVAWTAAQWAAHPGAVHIDQDPYASDTAADVLDIEDRAATADEAAAWLRAARSAYLVKKRPGQRWPALYCSRSRVTEIVSDLIKGAIIACPLWIADYSGGRAKAAAEVLASSGPWLVIGRQYADAGLYDASVFSDDWLSGVHTAAAGPLNWTEAIVDAWPMIGIGAGQVTPSTDVRRLQRLLSGRTGVPALAVDGVFGTATQTAVQRFQHLAAIGADGICGPATWQALAR